MGTHISRVKSVDLDSWTDEQLQSVLNWGNGRANKYWEAKLAAGHKPSDGKVESFIRTKYELKRWVMDGPMPDPSTLDDDDNIPLSLVKEKKTIERKESIRKASIGQSSQPPAAAAAAPPPQVDLIGGDPVPPRASTTSPPVPKVRSKAAPAPPKTTNAKDSLLGLDFFGDQTAAPPRPSSTTGTPGPSGSSRPDLKQSILSLYATAPRPQAPQQPQHAPTQSFGDAAPQSPHSQPPSAGLVDAFGGLGFGNAPAAPPKPADPFASLTSPTLTSKSPASTASLGGLGGGSFFDAKPAQPPAPAPHRQQSSVSSGSFAGFGSLASSNNIPPSQPAQPSSSAMGDLFDLSTPAPAPAPAPAPQPAFSAAPPQASTSIFNLTPSAPKSPPPPAVSPPLATTAAPLSSNTFGGNDVWGNAWGAPDPAPPTAASTSAAGDFGGWASPSSGLGSGSLAGTSIVPGQSGFNTAPQVSADEEFGGWASSTGGNAAAPKPASGFGGSDDLFSNVWQ